jgi:hypothetical protein
MSSAEEIRRNLNAKRKEKGITTPIGGCCPEKKNQTEHGKMGRNKQYYTQTQTKGELVEQ